MLRTASTKSEVRGDTPASGCLGEREQMDLRLQCPRCRGRVQDLRCQQCDFHIREDHGILHALPPERIVHYARFVNDYERIREAEGRGSEDDEFYLALPYQDTTRRNQEQWQIRARTFECLVERVLRSGLPSQASVLDLGSGNCWLSFRLALEGYRPVAVDLLTNERDGLGAAVHYQNYLPEFFPRFRAELTRLPFEDGQFDAVVFNASFHYTEDDGATLREALRCVANNGVVIICDTPWYSCALSGREMVSERHSSFLQKYGTASDSIESIEFLTDDRLRYLEERLAVHWSIYRPAYGFRWVMRPLIAKLKHKREPARFRIYVARKTTA